MLSSVLFLPFSTRGTENSKVCEKAENTRKFDKNRIHSDRLTSALL